MKEKRATSSNQQALDDDFDQAKEAPDEELDQIWSSLREELHTVDPNVGPRSGPAMTKSITFVEACKIYDAQNTGYIAIIDLRQALVKARIQPLPTEKELERIISAL